MGVNVAVGNGVGVGVADGSGVGVGTVVGVEVAVASMAAVGVGLSEVQAETDATAIASNTVTQARPTVARRVASSMANIIGSLYPVIN